MAASRLPAGARNTAQQVISASMIRGDRDRTTLTFKA